MSDGPTPPDDAETSGSSERDAGAAPAVLTEEERQRQEIEEARTREEGLAKASLDVTVTQRFVAAVTGMGVIVTFLAIASALVVGALVIMASDDATREALGYFGAKPSDALAAAWEAVSGAYGALLSGSLGGMSQMSETLVSATPLILTGLAVALPFRAGLFNIGGEGQLIAGGLLAALAGFTLAGLPMVLHLPLAVLAGLAGGAVLGWLPGFLKARTGAHEVITTIMLNNTMILVTSYLLSTALYRRPDRADPISQTVEPSARLPRLVEAHRANWGLLLALAIAVVIFWLLDRSSQGFEINAVGQNPHAATSAGMSPSKVVVLAMSLGGALAGAGGAAEILGVQGRITPGFSAGLGFDGITVALLGRGGVGGTVAAGLLLGGLRSGGRAMQAQTGTSLDLVVVIQALIIVFIAAPGLVRALYRIKAPEAPTQQIAKGWGQ